MAKRRNTSPAEDVMDLVAMLPWWAGIVLSVASYLLLHGVASQTVAPAAVPAQIGAMVTHTLWKTIATVGQYVLPILCMAGAGMSAWRRKERNGLVNAAVQSEASDALDRMSWREFEMLVGEGFRLQGYQVVETGGGADGGVDLVLRRSRDAASEKFLVQCKQWRAFKVGVDVVRELYGVMAAKGAAGGFVVTSGQFTDAAVDFASGRNVTLIDGPKLHRLLRDAKAEVTRSTTRPAVKPAVPAIAEPLQALTCPVCAKPMARRTAKRGANAGGEFWGCTGYPTCRGTRPIP